MITCIWCRSQWSRGLRRRSAAARLLRSWVRIPPGQWMFVCCVLSGRGLCDELITRPEEFYRLWCVVVCDLETSRIMRRSWPALVCSATAKKKTCVWYFTKLFNCEWFHDHALMISWPCTDDFMTMHWWLHDHALMISYEKKNHQVHIQICRFIVLQ